ncbi:MAG: CDP-alcohol phosphatidyltransferase family protein [Eubacteriales bacterium]|nr:CDP-alcohol phosphatidyltransferase family protein [Eubacteriales bacterium]
MIGIFDYTVILTYISLLSAGTGIIVSLHGNGHPYWGIFFLLICGICDLFDGKIARTKKNRTEMERNFGIQIDSLSDMVAFGVLPACIGVSVLWNSRFLNEVVGINDRVWYCIILKILLFSVLMLYMLGALIRLAYYNVTEEERQKTEGGKRKYFIGFPVTISTFIFPLTMVLQYLTPVDFTLLYFVFIAFMSYAFVSKIHFPKPGAKMLSAMICFGLVEVIVLFILNKFVF